jgi:tetratricopeptide (TPR) repeat protein
VAEHAYGFRQGKALVELSQVLLALPLPAEYKSAARFFRGLGLRRLGEVEAGNKVLERVATEPAHRYSARAIQSVGAVIQDFGDYELAIKLYSDAARYASERGRLDPATVLFTQKNIAMIHGLKGDHRRAVADFERLAPFVRAIGHIHPHVYYDYLNSLAVELSNVGRLEEAAHASRIAVSSPFSTMYPEWRQTFDEIALKRRRASHSAVAVRQPITETTGIETPANRVHNLVRLPQTPPVTPQAPDRNPYGVRARVLNFHKWKIKASSRAGYEGVASDQRHPMTTGQKLIRLMDLISKDETDDETIDRILEAVEQIVVKGRREKLD